MFINLITHGCLNCTHGSGVYVNRFNRDRGLATTMGIQVLMAILLAWIKRTDFDQEYTRLEGLRAIDRQGVLKRRGGDALFSWARSSCAGNLPQLPRYPVVFICSAKAGALWHVEREGAP